MGIFTKRTFLSDNISFVTKIRFTDRRYGLFSLFTAAADLNEEDKKQVNGFGVIGSDKAAYYHLRGNKRLFKNEIFSVDFFDSSMKMFASMLSFKNKRIVKYYDTDRYSRIARTQTYDLKKDGSYVCITRDVNLSTTDKESYYTVIGARHFFMNKNPKDDDIIMIDRVINADMLHSENNPKTDLITITYGNNRSTTIVTDQDDNIIMAQTQRPMGEFIYVFKPNSLKYGNTCGALLNIREEEESSKAIDFMIELNDPTSTLLKEGDARCYEFSTTLIDDLLREVKGGEYPKAFIAKVISQ